MLEARSEQGLPTKLVDDQPSILSISAPYWRAFLDLSGQRGIGMAPGEIRREAITDWLDAKFIDDPVERDRFYDTVQMVDREYLAMAAKDLDKKAKPEGAKG